MRSGLEFAALLAALSLTPAFAETIRCGNLLVSESSTPEEIVGKCGSPSSKTSSTEDIRAPVSGGPATRVVGTSTTETWTWQRGSSAPPFVVVIVDGKVRSLNRQL